MSFGSASVLHKVAIPVSGLAALLQIIAVATPGWYMSSGQMTQRGLTYTYTLTLGLWQNCLTTESTGLCSSPAIIQAYFAATRAMEVIGMLLCIAAVALLLIHIFLDQYKKYTSLGFCVAAFVSAFFIMIGVIVYGAEMKGGQLYYSFGLAIVAAILMVVSGVLGLMGRRGADN